MPFNTITYTQSYSDNVRKLFTLYDSGESG